MSDYKFSFDIEDRENFHVLQSYQIKGLLSAIGHQNADILAKLKGTSEEEEFKEFIENANTYTKESMRNDTKLKNFQEH